MKTLPGTITQISPQDGLGWITLDDGAQIRFGGTACAKNLVLAIGARVGVAGTAPGYGGVTKALSVLPLDPPPPAPPKPAREKRANLAALEALDVPFDEPLRAIVARADADDAFFDGLEQLMFELAPMRAEEIDCHAPAFFVVAMDGTGSAYGVYRSPDAPGLPWVYWEHEDDTLAFVAPDTASFFAALLAYGTPTLRDQAHADRVRAVLGELGIALPILARTERFLDGQPAAWLPPGPLDRR